MNITDLITQSYRISAEHGWWDDSPSTRVIPEKLALIHSEVSEALEAYRDGDMSASVRYDEHGKPEGFVVELADVLIRIGDLCGYFGFDLEDAVTRKMLFNQGRSYRHGGKAA